MMPDSLDKRRQFVAAYKECFGTEAGQIVLADLEKQNFAEAQVYVPGSFDGTAYNCGRQEVVLRIKRRLATTAEDLEPRTAKEQDDD